MLKGTTMKANLPSNKLLTAALPDDTTVKVIGLGGVGGIVARYGSIFLASLRRPIRMVLVDGDSFEQKNATRMLFSDYGNKADVTAQDLVCGAAETLLTLLAVPEYVTAENIHRLIQNGDIILLAVDNHATRKRVNDHCRSLSDITLISGGNDGAGEDPSGRVLRGTYGNCMVYIRRRGEDCSPPLTRYHPEIAEPEDTAPDDKNCVELITSGQQTQVLFANLAAASAMLNAFWLYACGALHYSEVAFDIAEARMQPLPLPGPRHNQ